MLYFGYVRVSTEKQGTDVQRYEIEKFFNKIKGDGDTLKVFEEKISGTVDPKKRKIHKILRIAKKGDFLITAEISRLSRSMQGVFDVMKVCINKGIIIYSIKEHYELKKNDPMSKLIMSVYAYAAESERNLIAERTREGLAALKRAGIKLGRPVGSKSKVLKLDDRIDKVVLWLNKGIPKTKMAKRLKCRTSTIYDFMGRRLENKGGKWYVRDKETWF